MKKLFALAGLMLLTACLPAGNDAQNGDAMSGTGAENMMIEDGDPSNDDADMVSGTGAAMQGGSAAPGAQVQSASYMAYSDGVLMNGTPKILFFHAAWCPICRAADEQLTGWYGARRPTIDTYKVDYDTQTELKAKYGVTYQHTFVLVDGEGNMIQKVQGPSETALQALIGA